MPEPIEPVVLLRDTPEDRERLVAAIHLSDPKRASYEVGLSYYGECEECHHYADAILAALRGSK